MWNRTGVYIWSLDAHVTKYQSLKVLSLIQDQYFVYITIRLESCASHFNFELPTLFILQNKDFPNETGV